MKIVAILRKSKKKTRVLLEDGFELCVDSSTMPKVGDEVDIKVMPMVGETIRPLRSGDEKPTILRV